MTPAVPPADGPATVPPWYDAERAVDLAVVRLTRAPDAVVLRGVPLGAGVVRLDGRTGSGVDGFASWSVLVWGTHRDTDFGPPPHLPPEAAGDEPLLTFHTVRDEGLLRPSPGERFAPLTDDAVRRLVTPAPSPAGPVAAAVSG